MFSLRLVCKPEDVDFLSAELFELGTIGIRELEMGSQTILLAGFESAPDEFLNRFAHFSPEWEKEEQIDWVQQTRDAWPPRLIGQRIFLVPPWSNEFTPAGRVRVIQNPGMASGTGEHPCTQLALMALEECVTPGSTVADIGTGSGILAITAAKLGSNVVAAVDTDLDALKTARGNFALNQTAALLAQGSADCIGSEFAAVTVANINGTVLLAILDELLRITKPGGKLIVTGFPESELAAFQSLLGNADVTALNEWRCVVFAS